MSAINDVGVYNYSRRKKRAIERDLDQAMRLIMGVQIQVNNLFSTAFPISKFFEPLSEQEFPGFRLRTINQLRNNGIERVGDLVQLNESHLRNLPNIGEASIEEIKTFMSSHNLYFGMGKIVEEKRDFPDKSMMKWVSMAEINGNGK